MPNGIGGRLKQIRTRAGLSLREVSERCGIAASYLSSLERDGSSPTLATVTKILHALDSDLEELLSSREAGEPTGPVFRRSAMRHVSDAGRRYTLVLPAQAGMKLEMMDEYLFPGEPEPEFEDLNCDVAGLVLSGTLSFEIEGESASVLCPGDAFYVPEGRRHRGRCLGPEPVHLVTAYVPPKY